MRVDALCRHGSVGRWMVVVAAWGAVLAAPAGRTDAHPLPPSGAELQRFAEARQRGETLRAQLDALARLARAADVATQTDVAPELLDRLRELRQEYLEVRSALFELGILHAPAIVARLQDQDRRALLLKVSLALMAGTELLRNVHAVATTLGEGAPLKAVWNAAHAAHGIPAGSWDAALRTYRTAHYHDLFRDALKRLRRHQSELEQAQARPDEGFVTLFPDGVEAGLLEAERNYALLRTSLAEEELSQDREGLRDLVERAKRLRADWVAAGTAIRKAMARDGGLVRGAVHVQLQTIKRDYLDVREALYQLAFKHLPKFVREDIPYPPGFRLRAVSLSLLAGVTLYENAQQLQTQIVSIPGARALLNQGDPALGIPRHLWDRIEREFYRVTYRNFLSAGIRLVEPAASAPDGAGSDGDPLLAYVRRELTEASAVPEIQSGHALRQITRVLHHYLREVTSFGMSLPQEGKLQLSRGFGNLIGAVELRKGKLFGQREWLEFVRRRLQPGDLLLERTPFRLTDVFIPGHFGHVALYTGTDAELGRLGLLGHPWVAPHRKALGEGRTIIEALRDGTQINTLERFLNVDDLAILRPKPEHIPLAAVPRAIALAFTHVGKKYDFAFDTNTWDALVCSELAFQTYVDVPWRPAKILTAYTMAPDDVAALAGSDPTRPFGLVTFIHDGRVVHDLPTGVANETVFVRLLGSRYARAQGEVEPTEPARRLGNAGGPTER